MSLPAVTPRGRGPRAARRALGLDVRRHGDGPVPARRPGRSPPRLLGSAAIPERLDLWYGIVLACFLVGAATGGVLFGWLGDKIGRVRAMTVSVLLYSLCSGLSRRVADRRSNSRCCGSSARWAWAASGRSASRW